MGKMARGPGGSCLFGPSGVWLSVTQVLSKEELGPTAGVNLGSSAYLRLPKTSNEGRRRLINIVCLGAVSSMKGDEPQL